MKNGFLPSSYICLKISFSFTDGSLIQNYMGRMPFILVDFGSFPIIDFKNEWFGSILKENNEEMEPALKDSPPGCDICTSIELPKGVWPGNTKITP